MLLVDTLKDIHPDKLPTVLHSYISDGREPEVRQAIPELAVQHPHMREQFAAILATLQNQGESLDLISEADGIAIVCAYCGGSVSKQSPNTRTVICQYCGRDAEQSTTDGLSQWKGKIDTQAKFSIGSFFHYDDQKWQAIGVQKYSGKIKEWDSEDKSWEISPASYTLWWMLNKERELRWLSDYGGKRYWSTPYVPQNPELPKDQNKRIEYGSWTLDFAAGEFSYHPKINDQKKSWEFGTRPAKEASTDKNGQRYVYSTEAKLDNGNATEYEFFRSVGISNKQILQGLGSTELLSKISRWRLTSGLLAGAAILSLASGFGLKAFTKSEQILTNESVYEKRKPIAIGELRIEDTPTVLQFNNRLLQSLPKNRFAGLDITLETNEGAFAGEYYAEFWRETGYDDGYYDENQYLITKDLRIDEPGTYKISAMLSSSNSIDSIKSSILVTTNPVQIVPFFMSLFAGIAGAMLCMARSKSIAAGGASLGGKLATSKPGRKRSSKKGEKGKKKNKNHADEHKNKGNRPT